MTQATPPQLDVTTFGLIVAARDVVEPAPPEYVFCGHCRDHADFESTEDGWRSVCCNALPIPVDID